jgi:hypothetical protein
LTIGFVCGFLLIHYQERIVVLCEYIVNYISNSNNNTTTTINNDKNKTSETSSLLSKPTISTSSSSSTSSSNFLPPPTTTNTINYHTITTSDSEAETVVEVEIEGMEHPILCA